MNKSMYKNLNAFIDTLEKAGELLRVKTPVSAEYEIAEITDRQSKLPGGGKALLFENTGTEFPVATNLFGSHRRICMALGVETLDELSCGIESMFKKIMSPKEGFSDKIRLLPTLMELAGWMPVKKKGRGLCQQVVMERPDLSELPILKCWPHDGGRFVTFPMVNTLDPESGVRNVGMYRMQVFGPTETGMHWHKHKTGERHYRQYQKRGDRMPVTVCLGGDPAYTYAAMAPMPDNMDEYLLAGFIRKKPVELVKSLTNDLYIPSDCDFVIEGYVDPAEEKRVEGPFGDHTGFYSLQDRYPVFHVTCITHRAGAVYPGTIVGVPPQEDAWMALATEKIFLVPIRLAVLPEVTGLHMPFEGVAHNIAVAAIDKSYPGQAIKAASSMWGAGQMMFNKFMLVADSSVDIHDPAQLAPLLSRLCPDDIYFSKGPLDVLDHAAPAMGFGGKMMADLTARLPEEAPAPGPDRLNLPGEIKLPPDVRAVDASMAALWRVLFVFTDSVLPVGRMVPELLRENSVSGIKYVVVFDGCASSQRPASLVWLGANNCDPSRDVEICDGVVLFDARSKLPSGGYTRPWPNVVTSSAATIALVDEKWSGYGLGAFEPSPSPEYMPLVKNGGAEVE